MPRLIELILQTDPVAVDDYLRDLDGAQLTADRAWFEGSRRWFSETLTENFSVWWQAGEEKRCHALPWIEGLCGLALCGPQTAARRVRWADFWSYLESDGEALFVQRLWDAPAPWVAEFVGAATSLSLGGNARNSSPVLARVIESAVLHHGLPCPTGPTFFDGWLRKPAWPFTPLVDELRSDALMPELAERLLESGLAGQAKGLSEAVLTLVAEGRLDRTRMIDVALEQLTTQQSVSSQRALVGVLQALQLKVPEITGGLSYLLGVLATSNGAVGVALLPAALDLVNDTAGLTDLVTVVAGRTERKQKDMVLRELRGARLRTMLGQHAVRDALVLLADGDPDAAFSTKVQEAISDLDGAPRVVAEAHAVGLWDLTPSPGEPGARPYVWGRADPAALVRHALRSGPSFAENLRWVAHHVLAGHLPLPLLSEAVVQLARDGGLSAPRLATVLDDVFLSGGLRLAWPTALDLADTLCGMAARPTGLAGLLRTLAKYAIEVPHQAVPPHIEALAADSAANKTAHEARALGAALLRVSPKVYAEQLRSHPTSMRTLPAPQGLWHLQHEDPPHPSTVRLPRPGPPTLDELRARVQADLRAYYERLEETLDGGMCAPSLLLASVVEAVQEQGAPAVQAGLAGVSRLNSATPPRELAPGPVSAAIDLWASGTLTAEVFWARALSSEPPAAELDDAASRVTFLLCCEALMLADRGGQLLSTPTYADGTLCLDDLLVRLRATPSGALGPLDLRQALLRLRAASPAGADELTGLVVLTATELTDPTGSTSFDAAEVVRAWAAGGGLPPLQSYADGCWRHSAEPPVSWSLWQAAHSRAVPESPGYGGSCARVFPLWPDLLVGRAHSDWPTFNDQGFRVLSLMSGHLGPPVHDDLLTSLASERMPARRNAVAAVSSLARCGRLDPEAAAVAATGRLTAGTMSLARVTHSCEQILLAPGAFRYAWPVVLSIAAAACAYSPVPAGLPGLLRLLTAYAPEVPEPTLPDAIRDLAAGRGKSQSHLEARALVAALGGST